MPAAGHNDPTLPSSQTPTGSAPPAAPVPRALPAQPGAGAVISRYRIESVLGEGGMGVVYLARQEKPDREVALKVIRPGFATEKMLRRFEHESEVLGRLLHPGIAQIYEAGVWTSPEREREGLPPTPFFAMELVKGVTLTRYATEKKLSTRERLELLAKVCDAVQHAHQKGVIHRDLKPGNILVTEDHTTEVPGSSGSSVSSAQPKILDFGVARATDSDLQSTMQTDVGAIIGTIPYMSPEQVGGDPNDLDTRSDVYALGVIAYELLVDRLPYDLERKMIHEAARIIREDEPTRLSSIDRTLRGDVETIVGHALEKDKARRYTAASALAADIRRYLSDEPIAARPANTWYQLRKFSRRNRTLVTGIAATFIVLIAGIVATGLALKREAEQRAEAVKQQGIADANATEARKQQTLAEANAAAEARARKRAEDINTFVTKALKSSDPMDKGKQDATIAEAMDNAVKEIESGAFKDDPETEAGLRETIGTILKNNGKYAEAQPLLEQALTIRERVLKGDDPLVGACLNNLAGLYQAQGRYAQAEEYFMRALAIWEKTLGPGHAQTGVGLNNLANLSRAQGQYAKAEQLFARTLEIWENKLGPDHVDVASVLDNLALLYGHEGKFTQAEPLFKRSLAIRERALGPDHPLVGTSLNNLGELYRSQGEFAHAEPLFARALAIDEKALGPDHPLVATDLNNLAALHHTLGQSIQAEELYQRALAICERSLDPNHPDIARSLNNLANLYFEAGRYAEAEPRFERSLAIREKALGPDHPDVADSLDSVAELCKVRGDYPRAEALYTRALSIHEKMLGPDHPDVAVSLNNLASVYFAEGRYAQAESLSMRAHTIREKAFGPEHPEVAGSLANLATLFLTQGQYEQAEPLSLRALAIFEKTLGPDHPGVATTLYNLACTRQALGKHAEARHDFDEAVAMFRRLSPVGSPQLARAIWRSASARLESNDAAAALPELEEALAMAERILPPDHPQLEEYRDTLATCKAALDAK